MKPKEEKEKAIDEIVENNTGISIQLWTQWEIKRVILDQDKIYDWQSIYIRDYLNTLFMTINTFLLLSIVHFYAI